MRAGVSLSSVSPPSPLRFTAAGAGSPHTWPGSEAQFKSGPTRWPSIRVAMTYATFELLNALGVALCHAGTHPYCHARAHWNAPQRGPEGWIAGEWARMERIPAAGALTICQLHGFGAGTNERLGLDAEGRTRPVVVPETEPVLWLAEVDPDLRRGRLLRPHPEWSMDSVRQWAADCAEHVAFLTDRGSGPDARVLAAIAFARRIGEAPEDDRRAAAEGARAAAQELRDGYPPDGYVDGSTPWFAADAARMATSKRWSGLSLTCGGAVVAVGPNSISETPRQIAEREWQYARFCERFGIALLDH